MPPAFHGSHAKNLNHMLRATCIVLCTALCSSVIATHRQLGLLSLGQWDSEVTKLTAAFPLQREEHESLWTHAVSNELAAKEGKHKFLDPSTRHYLEQIDEGVLVNSIHLFAKIVFSITGSLVAHPAG
jgi:hypothetical protein